MTYPGIKAFGAIFMYLYEYVDFLLTQPTVMNVLEYHLNWFEATGFTPEQVNHTAQKYLRDVVSRDILVYRLVWSI